MILNMFLLIGSSLVSAQEAQADRFSRFCDQLATAAPVEKLVPNSRVGNLMAVVDSANGTPDRIRDAVKRSLTYSEFKAEAKAKGISISDQYHQQAYHRAARLKCDSALTESGAGQPGIQAHSQPNREQFGRRVDDALPASGTPTGSPGTTSEAVD